MRDNPEGYKILETKKESLFEQLDSINVNEYTEKKGQFTYLSWAWAVRELLKVAPDATWKIHEWGYDGVSRQPYMQTEAGCFVQVTVTVHDIERTQVHPVLDNRNQTIEKPNAFQVNTSIQRCLAKAIALHGLGLYIYAGEELPYVEELTDEQIKTLIRAGANNKEVDVTEMLRTKKITSVNYEASLKKLERLGKK